MRRRRFIILVGLSATVPLAGCGRTGITDTTATTDSTAITATASDTRTGGEDDGTPPPTTGSPITDTATPAPETATPTPLTLQTPQTETSHRILEHERSEEDYSTGWTFPGATGTHSVVSPGLQGTDYALELDGFQKGYLVGAHAADRGLQQGDRFAFSFKPTNYTGTPSIMRFEFACDGDDGDTYRIEFEGTNTAGSDWSLEKQANGSQVTVDAAGDGVGADLGDEYRVEVDWNTDDTRITARWYNPDGTQRSTPLSITDTEFTQPGVCLLCNANATALWDEIQPLLS